MIDFIEDNIAGFVLIGTVFLIALSIFVIVFLISIQREISIKESLIKRMQEYTIPKITQLEIEKESLNDRLNKIESSKGD